MGSIEMRVRITTTYHLTDQDRREIWWMVDRQDLPVGVRSESNGSYWMKAGKDPARCPMASYKVCREHVEEWYQRYNEWDPQDSSDRFIDLDAAIKWFDAERCENEGCGKELEDCWCEDEEEEVEA
jgi:hypothetical protein